jgi:hypothetical protein
LNCRKVPTGMFGGAGGGELAKRCENHDQSPIASVARV